MPAIISTPALLIQEIVFADYWQNVLELRDACRQDKDPQLANQLFPAGMYDEFDDTAMHWGIFDDDNLIASARLSVHRNINELPDRFLFSDIWDMELPAPIASLNRLSVATAYRARSKRTIRPNKNSKGEANRVPVYLWHRPWQKEAKITGRWVCRSTQPKTFRCLRNR